MIGIVCKKNVKKIWVWFYNICMWDLELVCKMLFVESMNLENNKMMDVVCKNVILF